MAAAAEVLVCAGAAGGGGKAGEQTPPHLAARHTASHLPVSSAVLELQPHPRLRTAGTEPPSGVFSHPQRPVVGTGKPHAVGMTRTSACMEARREWTEGWRSIGVENLAAISLTCCI